MYIHGYPQKWEPQQCYAHVDENGELCCGNRDSKGRFCREVLIDDPDGEGEWVDDIESGQVLVVMVGDDKKYTVDIDDLTKIGELEFCRDCGQIGCGCNVYE